MITATHITNNQDVDGGQTATTASINPVANRLYIIGVTQWKSGGVPLEPTVAGAGLTWVKILTLNPVSPTDQRITLFRAMSSSPSSGALTIDAGNVNNMIA